MIISCLPSVVAQQLRLISDSHDFSHLVYIGMHAPTYVLDRLIERLME